METSRDKIIKLIHQTCGDDAKILDVAQIPCNGCGECCRRGYLALTLSDIFRIAEHLGTTPAGFVENYCNTATITRTGTDGRKTTERAIGFKLKDGCQFREDGVCAIYSVRPAMCRLYPFSSPSIVRGDALAHRALNFPACGTGGFIDKSYHLLHDIDGIIDYNIGIDCMKEYMDRNGDSPFNARLADNFYRREIMKRRNPAARERELDIAMKEMKAFLRLLMNADTTGKDLFSYEELVNLEKRFPVEVKMEEKV